MKKRVGLIDNVLCGIVAYVVTFVFYEALGGKYDASPPFFWTLGIALAIHGNMIRNHPGTHYRQ